MMNVNSIQEFLRVKGDVLELDGLAIEGLADEYPTPFYIYSRSTIKSNVLKLKKVVGGVSGDVKIFYAMKALSHRRLLTLLKGLGIGVEAVSPGELKKALEAGFSPDEIVYNGIGKTPSLLKALAKAGYSGVNLDSEYEFHLAYEMGLLNMEGLGVRVNIEVKKRVLDTSSPTSKFGVEPGKLYKLVRKYGVRRIGLHTHLGSQITEKKLLKLMLDNFTDIIDKLSREYGVEITYLDVGGGIPKNYLWSPVKLDTDELDTKLFIPRYSLDTYGRFLKALRKRIGNDIPIYVEPGRYIVADAGMLIARVVGYKERLDGTRWIYLDTGFTHLLSGFLYKWYFPLVNISRISEDHNTGFRVAGILCDSDDLFHDYEGEKMGRPRLPYYRPLPSNTYVGDVVAFLHVGAYNYEEASTYNSIEKPEVIFI